jgi:thioredoxin-dependent peroxiredoxin
MMCFHECKPIPGSNTYFPFLILEKEAYAFLSRAGGFLMSDTAIQEQQPAPDFTLPAVGSDNVVKNGQVHLADLKGRTVVLYFYPKDDTPGCTAEACSFRDADHEMQKRGVIVLGISADDIPSHQKFADKYGLSFPLLADTDTTISQLYGVWKEKNYAGKKYMGVNRETFLIDKDGIVRKVWPKVKAAEHAQEVLETIESLGL